MSIEQSQQLIAYLKKYRGFHRLLDEMRNKYYNLGSVKGALTVTDATIEEKEALGGLMQKNFNGDTDIKIRAQQLQKAFSQTPYGTYTLDELVLAYFGNEVRFKKEEQLERQQAEENFFSEIIERWKESRSGQWLIAAWKNRDYGWEYLHKHYRKDAKQLRIALEHALYAGNGLPVFRERRSRQALFSAAITGDPHTFDYGRMESHILFYILRFYFHPEKTGGITEVDKWKLYHQAGIQRDDLLNNTTVYGISCILDDGQEHQGTKGFLEDFEPMILTLHLLLRTQKLRVNSSESVYVVENSGVFAELVARLGHAKAAVICTNGQMNEASVFLLEMLNEQGYQIFYSGDFDPEGLLIAERLKCRIPKVCLWHFTEEDYYACHPSVTLDASRLQKLAGIQDQALQKVAEVLEKNKKAGYQEGLLELYLADISQNE